MFNDPRWLDGKVMGTFVMAFRILAFLVMAYVGVIIAIAVIGAIV